MAAVVAAADGVPLGPVGSSVAPTGLLATGVGDGVLRLLFFASATVANFFCTASFTTFTALEHKDFLFPFDGFPTNHWSDSLFCFLSPIIAINPSIGVSTNVRGLTEEHWARLLQMITRNGTALGYG